MTSDTKNVSIINFCGMNDSSHTERKAEDQMAVYEGITYSRQDKYDVEKDLRCERIDLEDSDSSTKTAYMLCSKSALIGEFIVSDEAKNDIIRDASRSFEQLCSEKKNSIGLMEGRVLAAACVLLSQSSAGDSAEQALQDDGNAWQPILNGLHFDEISQKTGCSKQTARNRLCKILEDSSNIRFFTENGQRFYNTLRLHALSPVWSVHNLYDILYSFYNKNLECVYDADTNVAFLFTAGIRRRWEADSSAEEQKLRSDHLSSGLRELFIMRPNYMAAVCDALLEKMDHLAQGDVASLDIRNRWDALLLEWYRKKTEYEKKQMHQARKAAVRSRIVDRKENIHPEYVFENGQIILCIPGIRLPEIQERPIVKLYQNEKVVYKQQLSVYGDSVLLSTRSHRIPLNQIQAIQWDHPFSFAIHIISGSRAVYHSGNELFRDYFCFTATGNDVRLTRCSQMLRLIVRKSANLLIDDPEDNWSEDVAPYRSIRLWPESVRSIMLSGREILLDGKANQHRMWAYITPDSVSSVSAKIGTDAVSVYADYPILHVVVKNQSDAKNYQLSIDGNVEQLYCQKWENGQYRLVLPASIQSLHRVQVKNFENGIIVFERSYVVLPGFSYKFNKSFYLDVDCSGRILVETKFVANTYSFSLSSGNDSVIWKMGDIQFETAAPRLRAEICGKNAFYLSKDIWYEELKSSFLSVRAPEEIFYTVFFGNRLMVPNHLGNYEIGTEIDNRKPDTEKTIIKLIVPKEDDFLHIIITNIRYQEAFRDNPIIQNGRRILWKPEEAGYVGNERNAIFRLELENSLQKEPFIYSLSMKPDTIEKNFPCKEGTYKYVLWLTGRKQCFTSLPDLKLWEGTISVADPPEERFLNKHIILTHAYFFDPITKRNESAPIQRDGAVIDHIEYEGMREIDRQILPEYSGIMYFRSSAGWNQFSDRETEYFEKVNPVFFTIIQEGFLAVYLEGDEQILLNLKYFRKSGEGKIRIFSRKNELSRQEQALYLGFSDKFRYIEKEN